MNKFFTKASALVFICFGASLVVGASDTPHVGTIVGDVQLTIEDIRRPASATTAIPSDLPIHQCILDFSDTLPILVSTAKLGGYLFSEHSTGQLDLIDIAYLTTEGVAAGARKDPRNFGAFSQYVTNQDAIFNAFARSIGSIRSVKHDLSVLGNLATCEKFVRDTITRDLPVVLDELLKATTVAVLVENKAQIASGIVSLISADPAGFIPMFSKLLNTSYNGLASAAAVVTADVEAIKEKISGCGCFPCFGGKKKV